MIFQRINRSDPEKVFISVKNSYSTAAITVGQAVCFEYSASGDSDGVGVTRPATALLGLVAGIVESSSIAADDYGLVQVYGHNANALVTGGVDVAVGDPLELTNAKFFLSKAGGSTPEYTAWAVAGEAFTTAGGTAKKVFLKCL